MDKGVGRTLRVSDLLLKDKWVDILQHQGIEAESYENILPLNDKATFQCVSISRVLVIGYPVYAIFCLQF